ncbi:MAG: hypothetical protein LBQ14_05380 [Treponema sp.]|nr:hypothetical protein [Treponema sp.]
MHGIKIHFCEFLYDFALKRNKLLGLALVKKVIDITGAKISVMSKPGEGTTFTVRLKTAEKE